MLQLLEEEFESCMDPQPYETGQLEETLRIKY